MTSPKYANVSCSHCGRSFGPGDHGFSHCENHTGHVRDRLHEAAWDMRNALAALLSWIDEEDDNREGTLRRLEPYCNECTEGCTPIDLDEGPCVYHQARAALRKATAPI